MTPHRELLDALEERLCAPQFRAMAGSAPGLLVVRAAPERLTVRTGATRAEWDIEAVLLPLAEAPDARPRLLVRSAAGGPTYADYAVDGLVMSVFAMLLAAGAGETASREMSEG